MSIDADKFRFCIGQNLLDTPTTLYGADGYGSRSTAEAKVALKRLRPKLLDAQSRLFAQGQHGLLVVLQGMDTSGKDGLIRHIFRYVNPVGLLVHSFGPPTGTEKQEHFLARYRRALPPLGHIGVFNRSYYEQLMYLSVHPEQRVTAATKAEQDAELNSIREFERCLCRQRITILKVLLHISERQQRRRLLARARNPKKSWKLQPADLVDRKLWQEHYHAFQKAIAETHCDTAPWYVVPSDDKWVARYIVASAVLNKLEDLAPSYPVADEAKQALIDDVLRELG